MVVAHSLGCIATTYLPFDVVGRIQEALLAAPADPERRAVLSNFAPVPFANLFYRSVLVGSGNDRYCLAWLGAAYVHAWGRELLRLSDAGHTNIASDHSACPWGLVLLASLLGQALQTKEAGATAV